VQKPTVASQSVYPSTSELPFQFEGNRIICKNICRC